MTSDTTRPREGGGWARPKALAFGLMALVAVGAGCGEESASSGRVPSMLGETTPAADHTGNEAPVIEGVTLRPARPAPGRVVEATVEVADADGHRPKISYAWQTPMGRHLGSGRTLDTSGFEPGEKLELVVVADDGAEESEPFVYRFRLAEASVELAHVAIDASDGSKPGVVLEAEVESTNDRSGEHEVLYEWLVDGEVVGTDDELDTTSLQPGARVVLRARLQLENGETTSPVRSQSVVLGRGAPPEITSNPPAKMKDGAFRYRIAASSPEPGATLRYALGKGPKGMQVDAGTGEVSWKPGPDQRGRFAVELVASDQWGSGVAQTFEIQVDAPPSPPASTP